MSSIGKKIFLRKMFKKQMLSSFRRIKSTRISGSIFSYRIEQFKKTTFVLELIKTVDCFLDVDGNHTSNYIIQNKIFVN